MPSILETLAKQLQSPDPPAAELPNVRQSPTARPREFVPSDNRQAVELRPGLWRLRRSPAFPPAVWALPWGEMGVPRYVEFFDHWYLRQGSQLSPFWALAEYTTVLPPWHFEHLNVEPPADACFKCGRRLFYRTAAGDEFCACCHPLKAKMIVRGFDKGHNTGEGETTDDPPDLSNVEFFLKAGWQNWDYWG